MAEDGSTLNILPVEEVLDDWARGEMIILVDDAQRENEGDLAIATEKVTPQALSFMMRCARGLICTSISREVAEHLKLPLQTMNNNSMFHTPFAVSIDHRDVAESGITASGRCRTMLRMIAPDSSPEEFITPGSVIPLIANPAGVIGRQGQTEGSYDLSRIAGLHPSGVICEIMNSDGTMARGVDLAQFAKHHRLKVTSVAEIARYRIQREVLVRQVAQSTMNTDFGDFDLSVFEDDVDGKEHLALVFGEIHGDGVGGQPPLVRIHSECLTGDVFGSQRCDCSDQLRLALRTVVEEGCGVVLYLRQEGRGIGLANKLRAYELQDRGFDTVEANVQLGFAPDQRDFAVAAKILGALKLSRLRLMTNNPQKISALERLGIAVQARVPVLVEPTQYSADYLSTKRQKLGHLL